MPFEAVPGPNPASRPSSWPRWRAVAPGAAPAGIVACSVALLSRWTLRLVGVVSPARARLNRATLAEAALGGYCPAPTFGGRPTWWTDMLLPAPRAGPESCLLPVCCLWQDQRRWNGRRG